MHIKGTRRCDTQYTYNNLQLFYEMTCKEDRKYSYFEKLNKFYLLVVKINNGRIKL